MPAKNSNPTVRHLSVRKMQASRKREEIKILFIGRLVQHDSYVYVHCTSIMISSGPFCVLRFRVCVHVWLPTTTYRQNLNCVSEFFFGFLVGQPFSYLKWTENDQWPAFISILKMLVLQWTLSGHLSNQDSF